MTPITPTYVLNILKLEIQNIYGDIEDGAVSTLKGLINVKCGSDFSVAVCDTLDHGCARLAHCATAR